LNPNILHFQDSPIQPAVKLCLFSAHASHLIPSTPDLQLQTPNSLQLSLREPCELQLHAAQEKKQNKK